MRKTIRFFAVGVILSMLSAPALAADKSDSGWQWRLAPLYLWAVTLNGDQTIGTNTVPIDINITDAFDKLEGVFTANFEGVYNNTWGFIVDFTWVDLNGNQGPLNVGFEYILAEVDGYYRINRGEHNFDILAGLRYTAQETEISPTPIKIDQDWIDPIIGGRWWWGFADKWSLVVRGDFGGFGVGSDFTWQALGLVDWQPFKHVSFALGYRALYQDYKDGSGPTLFKYDVTTHGPLLGVNIKW